MSVLDGMGEHAEELKTRIVKITCVVLVLIMSVFCLGIRKAEILGANIIYPFPSIKESITNRILTKLVADFVPEYVEPIVTRPMDAMVMQMKVAVFLGILLASGYIIYHVVKFISPGLDDCEKKIIYKISIPCFVLFVLGASFAYVFIIPFTVDYLYSYVFAIERLTPLLDLSVFISFILMMLVSFGIVFTLPVIMVTLSSFGIVSSQTWLENWRYVIVAVLVFSALVTPDGSGITQIIVTLPILGLYGLGYVLSRYFEK